MTTADYLLLHDLPASLETAKGGWDRERYCPPGTSLHVIPNGDYDNGISRVDRMPAGWGGVDASARSEGLGKRIREVMEGKAVEEWDTIKTAVGRGESDAELEKQLNKVGAYLLHTWQGSSVHRERRGKSRCVDLTCVCFRLRSGTAWSTSELSPSQSSRSRSARA